MPTNLDALFAEVRKEGVKRAKADKWAIKAEQIYQTLMPCQKRLDEDPARRISVRAARRTGKSTGALRVITKRCLESVNSVWVIVGLTRASVKRNYWGDLQALNDPQHGYSLGIKFQHQELTATFPTGSKIYFVGADNASEIEKLRGGKYDGVLIDECKSYPAVLFAELVEEVIEPALLDKRGQLIIIGTPGDILAGPFYEATCEAPVRYEAPDGSVRLSNVPYGQPSEFPYIWSLHPWTLRDNVTVFRDKRGNSYTLWDEALKAKARNGWADDNPGWRREFLGLWVANNLKYVYRAKPHAHCYVPNHDTLWGLPEKYNGYEIGWRTVIGWDFGSKDGTAVTVWAFSDSHPGLWELYSERRVSTSADPLNISKIANWHKELEAQYGPFEGAVGDMAGLGTLTLDTLATEHAVYIEPAEKHDKNDHIELFNNDLDAGLVHFIKGGQLIKEMVGNVWLAKTIGTAKRIEDPATPNDICDAALYAFRWSRHRQARDKKSAVEQYTAQWWQIEQMRELEAAKQRQAQSLNLNLDSDWWDQ